MAKRSRLDSISVPKPCAEDWNKMSGGEKSRFCGICEKNVYNISAMTTREADKLLFENTEKVCIRMEKDAHGKVKTLKNQLHQITRQAPIAAGVLSATLAFSAVTFAQSEPVRINPAKVNIIQTAKDDASKPIISGTVYDEQNAVVPNVNITLRNIKNNLIQKVVSNRQGDYQFTNVEPSVYEIETDDGYLGFKKFVAKKIEVSGKNNLQLNIILQIKESEVMGDYTIVSPEKTVNKIIQTEKNNALKPSISGVVKDLSEGVVPNVKITLSDLKNNLSYSTTSSPDGKYQFNDLKPSIYRMEFEANGFKKSIFENIKIENKDFLLNAMLEVGSIICDIYIQPDKEIKNEPAKVETKLNLIDIQKLPTLNRKFFLGLTASSINKPQNQTNRISFNVIDSFDALVTNAKLVLKNQKSKKKFTASTNESGNVEFGNLPMGNYKLRVSADGYKTKEISLTVDEKTVSNQEIIMDAVLVTVGMVGFK